MSTNQRPARKSTNPGDSTMSTHQTDSTDTQTLAAYGTGTTAQSETDDPSRPEELETPDTPAQTRLAGQWTIDDLARLSDDGLFPTEIAAQIDTELTRAEIADRLRRAHVLEPQDDRRVLAWLYDAYDRSTTEIAAQACDGAVSSETIAYRLHLFGLAEDSSQDRLAELEPEDIGLSPRTGEQDSKYRRRTGGSA